MTDREPILLGAWGKPVPTRPDPSLPERDPNPFPRFHLFRWSRRRAT